MLAPWGLLMDVTAGSARFQDRKLGELCFFDVDQNIDDSQKTTSSNAVHI